MTLGADSYLGGIDLYLKQIITDLDTQEIVEIRFGDLVSYLPDYQGDGIFHQNDILYLAGRLRVHGLRTEPRLSRGVIERGLQAAILFYRDEGNINYESRFYKYGRLVVQVAVIMARADGEISVNEISSIKKIIWAIEGIGNKERIFLLAKAKYLLNADAERDESYRNYIRVALSSSIPLNKLASLSHLARKSLLDVAMDIAISDGVIDRREVVFLSALYKASELPVARVREDIQRYAKKKYLKINMISRVEYFEHNEFVEIDNILRDLLEDFAVF